MYRCAAWCGCEARVVFERPRCPTQRTQEGLALGISISSPDSHAVVM